MTVAVTGRSRADFAQCQQEKDVLKHLLMICKSARAASSCFIGGGKLHIVFTLREYFLIHFLLQM